ncbi:glycosyltransferase [Acinetobacter indicus]|uniref:glycosyltransferase n=1 Tax=Acinetobacter indicus TaxID=756892 RepID=UPI0034CF683C
MKEPVHILIIPSWYPQSSGDIGGSFFREQAIALTKYGYKVGVISPQLQSLRKLKQYFSIPHGLHVELDEKIPTYRWYYLNTTPKLFKYNINKWVRNGMKLFEKYIEDHGKPDVIHVHSILSGAFLANEIKNKYNIPFLITEHSTAYARGLINNNRILFLKSVLLNSSANIAVSNEFKILLNNIFEVNSWRYIPNIVNQDFLDAEISNKNNNFKYINICLLDPKKRVDILIYAFNEVLKKYPNLLLEIGGGGSEKLKLEKLVNELNIEKNVKFLGKLTREDVKIKVRESSVFVLSSEYETFGVVVIEALALGKPVISTKCGGPESIIVPSVGILVERNSIHDLAKAMIYIYENSNQYKSKLIKEYCKENFSERIVVSKLANIYSEILGK